MTRAAALAFGLLAAGGLARAAPPHPAPRPATKPAAPLPALPSLPRVRLEVSRDHVVVVTEVDLPRGTWTAGDLDLYVAFGAPGAPEALDAHLVSVPDGALEPPDDAAGDPLTVDRATSCPPSAQPLLGPAQMAGAVVHVPDAAFRRAVAPGGMAALRVRALLPLPGEDARTGREVLVRLGAALGTPLTLGRLQIANVARAEAHLCGPDADPWPLAIAVTPRPAVTPVTAQAPVAPVLAVRHAADDLCVRFW